LGGGPQISVLIFSTTFVRNISHSKKNWAMYDHKCTNVFMQSSRYSCHVLIKFGISGQIFETSSYIRFHANLSNGSRVVPCGLADRKTDMTKLTVAQSIYNRSSVKAQNIFFHFF
jgi:hypothetical protein